MLSTYFALIALAAVYRLADLSRDKHLALAAIFMLTLNWLFLFYAQELRMYTLLIFFVAWIVWSYWSLVETQSRVSWWIWLSLVASSGLILYVHYFGIFILAAIGVYHLLFERKNKPWFQVTIALIAGGMLFLPWLPTVIHGLKEHTEQVSSSMTAVDSFKNIASVYSNDCWLITAGCVLMIILNRKRLGRLQRFLMILTILAVTFTVLVNEIAPILFSHRLRYVLVFAPLVVSSFAIGLSFLPRYSLIKMLIIGVWLLAFITYSQNEGSYIATKPKTLEANRTPPFYSLVYHPDIEIDPLEPLLSLHPVRKVRWITATYYKKLIKPANLVHMYYDGDGELVIQTTSKGIPDLDTFVAEYGRFWLIYNPQETIDQQSMSSIFQWIVNYYRSCGRYLDDRDAVIERYVRDSDPC